MTNAVFFFALWLCKCTTQIRKKWNGQSCSILKGFIHLKRILYRFIYLHTMYTFSCWWNDRQCLDIPKLPLTFSSIRKKRHLFNKCTICSSQILFLISVMDVSHICLSLSWPVFPGASNMQSKPKVKPTHDGFCNLKTFHFHVTKCLSTLKRTENGFYVTL